MTPGSILHTPRLYLYLELDKLLPRQFPMGNLIAYPRLAEAVWLGLDGKVSELQN